MAGQWWGRGGRAGQGREGRGGGRGRRPDEVHVLVSGDKGALPRLHLHGFP